MTEGKKGRAPAGSSLIYVLIYVQSLMLVMFNLFYYLLIGRYKRSNYTVLSEKDSARKGTMEHKTWKHNILNEPGLVYFPLQTKKKKINFGFV